MDLRQYYAAIRVIEEQIGGDEALVVSEATSDGGKAGMVSEVTRHAGARLVVERKARLATPEEQAQHRLHRLNQEPLLPQQTAPDHRAPEMVMKQAPAPRGRKG